jgi:hypothetical protein
MLLDSVELDALPNPVGFGSGSAANATHMIAAGGVGDGVTSTESFLFTLV